MNGNRRPPAKPKGPCVEGDLAFLVDWQGVHIMLDFRSVDEVEAEGQHYAHGTMPRGLATCSVPQANHRYDGGNEGGAGHHGRDDRGAQAAHLGLSVQLLAWPAVLHSGGAGTLRCAWLVRGGRRAFLALRVVAEHRRAFRRARAGRLLCRRAPGRIAGRDQGGVADASATTAGSAREGARGGGTGTAR